MKDKDINMNLEEIEALCRMYHNCELSVAEEIELEYVLEHIPYRSELIDHTRELMHISRTVKFHSAPIASLHPRRRKWILGIAASVALLIGGFALLNLTESGASDDNSQCEYVAYISGKCFTGEKAKIICLAEKARMERLFQEAEDSKAEAMRQINEIKLLNNTSK